MNLREIGLRVRDRRIALGLSQQRLARLSGLSRATINQLETGRLEDLGVAKLTALMDLVGLHLETAEQPRPRHGLRMAARTASVSYRVPLDSRELSRAGAAGDLPTALKPQVATLLDDTPLPIIVSMVEEVARSKGIAPRIVWRHLAGWAQALRSPRQAWSAT